MDGWGPQTQNVSLPALELAKPLQERKTSNVGNV